MSSSAPSDTPNKDLTAQEKEDIENAQDEIKKRRGRPPKKRNFQQFNQDGLEKTKSTKIFFFSFPTRFSLLKNDLDSDN